MAAPLRIETGGRRKPPRNEEKRMELTEHLGELRTRILYSLYALLIGSIIAYNLFTPLYSILYRPFASIVATQNTKRALAPEPGAPPRPTFISHPPTKDEYNRLVAYVLWREAHPFGSSVTQAFTGFHEAFLVRLKISLLFGFILALPIVLWQIFGFVTPALTPEERRPLRILLPVSFCLLMFGVLVAYFTMFYALRWFLSYLGDFPDTGLIQDPQQYVLFFVKMMAAFGLAFQLPVILMGGGFIGLITSKGMIKNWRWGVVIAVAGGIFTPSNDLPSMLLMSIPLLLLYFISIGLVKIVEGMRARDRKARGLSD